MTGATAVVRFRISRRSKAKAPAPSVDLSRPENLHQQHEAEQAVRDSLARSTAASNQSSAVTRMASRLAEVRKNNHFAEGIRAAYGGDSQ